MEALLFFANKIFVYVLGEDEFSTGSISISFNRICELFCVQRSIKNCLQVVAVCSIDCSINSTPHPFKAPAGAEYSKSPNTI